MTSGTNTLDYWLNWRFLVCAIWVISPMVAGSILIWKYEGSNAIEDTEDTREDSMVAALYEHECWMPCLKQIHPIWLLSFRLFSFFILASILILNISLDGVTIFYFYTQWTFTLVIVYFGLGSVISIYGCCKGFNSDSDSVTHTISDAERGTYVAPSHEESMNGIVGNSLMQEELYVHQIAGVLGYSFQIIYQTCAGAAMLTDVVFWLVIFPFISDKKYKLNFLLVSMHSFNVLFLLGDTALNCLRFPLFRISYFVLWTSIFVLFQWMIHACISIWWPYPFLDFSSSYAPLWYLMVALLHVPCYGIFALFIMTKCYLLSRWFPQSIRCAK